MDKCPKCGGEKIEFVQECESGQRVCGGNVAYFSKSEVIEDLTVATGSAEQAKIEFQRLYGCGFVLAQGVDYSSDFVQNGKFTGELTTE